MEISIKEKKELKSLVKDLDVEFIHLQFTDILGVMKNITILPEQLDKALNGDIMFDGSSIEGFVRIEESDMCLKPDISTFAIFPWTTGSREARLICDVYNMDDQPFEGCPRNILRKASKVAREKGYIMNAGPECEFFLFHTDDRGIPILETHDSAGYFDLAPIDLGGGARNDIVKNLTAMGFKVEASHHEVAHGQHEIDFEYDNALKTADNIMTFKMVVRIIAQRHGLHATFMPKPQYGISGSGMHLNMSLSDLDGNNAFSDESNEMGLSDVALGFLAGVLEHAKGFTAIVNPTVNSYKRLIPGYEAPVLIAWSECNRSPLVRIPSRRGDSTRIELRNPDPTANPYLALAVAMKSGLEGMDKKLTPPEPVSKNLYTFTSKDLEKYNLEKLPSNLYEAIDEMSKDELVKDTLGVHAYQNFKEALKFEWDEYSKSVSQWEIDRYLRKY